MALSKERERKQYLQVFLKQYTSEFPCIVESRKGKHFAFCAVCGCDISVSHGGKTDVVAHVSSKKHNIIPIFEKVNLSLQAQAPQIHVLRSLLLELLRDIFSRFVNPSWLKRSPELLNLDYHSREAQKGDEDLIIGQETRTVVDKLKPSEQQEFFKAVRHYFVTVCDYMRHKFPLTDPALLNAEVVQLKTLDTMSFRKVRFFVDSFPAMLPLQPGESKMEAVDALEVEFSKLQAQDLPPHILQEERVDAQWRMVSQLRTADGSGEGQNVPCDHGMVIMFVPFTGKWTQIIGAFATSGNAKAEILAKVLIEATILAEANGLIVDFITCDGASWNRRMWTILGIGAKSGKITCSLEHPVDSSRQLYFLSDFPHLLKCVRNTLLQHPLNTPNGMPVRQAFKVDSTNVTLKAMPGLTSVHLQPNSFEKMRVSIAFQLFGDRVINGLLFYRDKLEASWGEIDATVEFFR
ncbi:hypothetical protein HPB50_008666 [Hyalomma asiaticum]|uniref:Uncharacterized protein n=1 Tax=Hyalomma asiaticum TaxID=266040 RepID=A0ACB7SM23_HYAAI|nr:hypothetical protein HPB50_008666 [Hyalomma asiaticum]